jgi:hypothetical protein
MPATNILGQLREFRVENYCLIHRMHVHGIEAENLCFLLLFLEKEEYIKARLI